MLGTNQVHYERLGRGRNLRLPVTWLAAAVAVAALLGVFLGALLLNNEPKEGALLLDPNSGPGQVPHSVKAHQTWNVGDYSIVWDEASRTLTITDPNGDVTVVNVDETSDSVVINNPEDQDDYTIVWRDGQVYINDELVDVPELPDEIPDVFRASRRGVKPHQTWNVGDYTIVWDEASRTLTITDPNGDVTVVNVDETSDSVVINNPEDQDDYTIVWRDGQIYINDELVDVPELPDEIPDVFRARRASAKSSRRVKANQNWSFAGYEFDWNSDALSLTVTRPNGDVFVLDLDDETDTLTISGPGDTYDYTITWRDGQLYVNDELVEPPEEIPDVPDDVPDVPEEVPDLPELPEETPDLPEIKREVIPHQSWTIADYTFEWNEETLTLTITRPNGDVFVVDADDETDTLTITGPGDTYDYTISWRDGQLFINDELVEPPQELPDVPDELPDVPDEVPELPEEVPDLPEEVPDLPEEVPDLPDEVPELPEEIPDVEVKGTVKPHESWTLADYEFEWNGDDRVLTITEPDGDVTVIVIYDEEDYIEIYSPDRLDVIAWRNGQLYVNEELINSFPDLPDDLPDVPLKRNIRPGRRQENQSWTFAGYEIQWDEESRTLTIIRPNDDVFTINFDEESDTITITGPGDTYDYTITWRDGQLFINDELIELPELPEEVPEEVPELPEDLPDVPEVKRAVLPHQTWTIEDYEITWDESARTVTITEPNGDVSVIAIDDENDTITITRSDSVDTIAWRNGQLFVNDELINSVPDLPDDLPDVPEFKRNIRREKRGLNSRSSWSFVGYDFEWNEESRTLTITRPNGDVFTITLDDGTDTLVITGPGETYDYTITWRDGQLFINDELFEVPELPEEVPDLPEDLPDAPEDLPDVSVRAKIHQLIFTDA